MSARARQLQDARSQAHPGLRLVRRRSRRLIKRGVERRFAPVVIAVVIFVTAAVFGVLLERVVLSQSAFELARIRERIAKEEARHEELLLEAARLESPARVENYARTALGMVDPTTVEYIVADVSRTPSHVASLSRPRPLPAIGQAAAQSGSPYDAEAP